MTLTSIAPALSAPELSFAQERMWFLEQLHPDAASNNCSTTLELEGVLNLSRLQQCINEIARRHESLRMRFAFLDGRPVQIVEPAACIVAQLVDMTHVPAQDELITRLALEENGRVFALDKLPLMRLTVFRRTPTRHVLQLTTHHIVWDAWSVNIFLRELLELYQSFQHGKPATLAPLAAQYRDFVRAERDWVTTPRAQRDLAFWKERLADLPALSVPTDYPRPAAPTFRGAAHMSQFSEELTEAIEAFCAERSVSLFMFTMAALQIYLSFLSGEKRISVGVTVANRTRREWEQVIGSFINVLVFSAELSAGDPFTAILNRVRNDALSIYEHGEYPFSRLVQELNPDRNLNLSPLFQIMLVYLSAPPPKLELPGIQGTYWNVETVTAKQDLMLIMSVREGRCVAAWEYNSALFRQETIERFSRQFVLLVDALVYGRAISPSVLITEKEKSHICEWNSTGCPQWLGGTLAELVALEQPADRIAVVCGPQQLSFGSLRKQVAGWAGRLKEHGVGPETRVGILMRRSPDLLVALLSVLGAGGSYVPIDDHWPVARIEDVVTAAGIKLLIVDADTRGLTSTLSVETFELDPVCFESSVPSCNAPAVEAHNCAYTIFTSGSTGKPKGIEVPREAVWNLLKSLASELHFSNEEVFLAVTTVSFDIAVLEWALPLMTGGCVVLIPYEQVRDPEELSRELARHRPTCMQATPSLWRMLVDSGWRGDPTLTVLAGGEALAEDLALRLNSRSREVWNLYGPTETTIWSMVSRIDTAAPNLGRPVANTTIHLLTGQFEQVAPGLNGEICIAGSGVTRGYLNQVRLTAEKFVPDPFSASPGARMFRTGDIGKWDGDGKLRFVARNDHQLKVHGVRVEAEEIEGCLRLHPAVRDAVVSLVGNGNHARLVAYLTLRNSTPEAQRERLLRNIGEFAGERLARVMVPNQFVVLNGFPLTTSGKVDRARLPIPAHETGLLQGASERPFLSSVEQHVFDAWKATLGHYHIGTSDTFFGLGGNSLLAAQLCTLLSRVLGVQIPVRLLFESPVFEQFALRVQELRFAGVTEQWPDVTPDAEHRFEPFLLTDIQEAYLLGRSDLFELGNVSTHSYFEVDTTRIDVDRFELVWRKLIQRHDMLRAVFTTGTQRVLPVVPDYTIRRVDAVMLSSEARERLLLSIREEMSHAVHPADQWPLFEIRATRIRHDLVRLHFSIDALIGDAFSSALLFSDWRTLYLDPEATLPEPQIQFRDYVLTTQALENSEMFSRSQRYWIDRLDETLRGPELPVIEAGRSKASRFSRRSLSLPQQAWQAIHTRALNRGLSPTTAIITAFSEVLAYWSRTHKFVLNLTQFNRLPLHPDVNRLVGDFTSILLLQVDATTPQTFAEFAEKTQQRLWDDLDHRLFSGTRVLRELRARLGTGQEILAPVVFTSTLGMTLDQSSEESWGDEVYSISQTPQVWLDHKVFEDRGSLGVDWDFAEGLFPEGVIDSMFEAYRHLLTALAEDEQIWNLSRQALHERFFLAPTPAGKAVAFGGANTLHGLFLEQAKQNPGAVAVIAQDRTLTYGELDAWSSAFAAKLTEEHIAAEELIAVVLPKGWEQAVAVLAIVRAGGAYMPIDPGEPEDRRFRMMQGGNVRFALTTGKLTESLHWPDGCRAIPVTSHPQSGVFQDASVPGHQLAYVIYTSGSTGQPKGVMIEHRSAVNTLRDLVTRLELGPADRTLALSALSFDLSVFDCFGIWAAGGAIVYPDPAKSKDPLHWLALLESEKVTIWNTVPALMEMLAETTGKRETWLRWILLSGDWIPVSLPARVAQRWPGARQLSLGGATEASIWSILFRIERVDPNWVRIPYGRAMWNQSMSVRHPSLEETPTWVVGEICIGGIGLARGYLGSPELTKERFVTHPTSGERLYRTGDLGRYLPTEDIEILGRADHQVKINGYRVELAEIEAALEAQPGIQQAIVNAETDAAGRKELVAYLVEKSNVVRQETGKNTTGASVSLKLGKRAIRVAHDAITIPLKDDLTPEEHQRIIARQSYRFFTDTAPSLVSVNEWLSAVERRLSSRQTDHAKAGRSLEWISALACRLKQTSVEGNVFPKYRYPSAGHLYPVQCYFSFADGCIPGLPGGHYYYHPQEHRLVRVGDCTAAAGPSPKLVFVGEMDVIEHQYHQASQRFCALEAGYMRALFLDTHLKPVTNTGGLPLTDSQRVVAAYELDVDAPSETPQMPSLLLSVGRGALHGAESGYYLRKLGEKLTRLAGQTTDSAWFGPNRELFERSHFAVVASAINETVDAFMNAGAVGQIMMEESVKFNLGLCPIGEISNHFVEAAGLPGTVIHGWVGGQIDPDQTHTWMTMPPPPDREALLQDCRERASRQLPAYMHPVRYFFVNNVPLTANNKVDRAMLKKYAQPAEITTPLEHSAFASETEKIIAEMLEGILKHSVPDLEQSFFEMGASSLIIIQLHTMVNTRYPDRVSFQDFFDHPSVREIARLIEDEPAVQTENAVEVIDI